MVEFRRNIWRLPGPATLLKQGHLDQAAQSNVQMAFEHVQGGRLHNLPGQPVSVLSHPDLSYFFHSERCFLMFRWSFLYFSESPLPLVLSLGITEESLALSSSHHPFKHFCTSIRLPLSLLFFRLNSHSFSQPFFICRVLQSLHDFCGPLLSSLQYVHASLGLRRSELYICVASATLSRGEYAQTMLY